MAKGFHYKEDKVSASGKLLHNVDQYHEPNVDDLSGRLLKQNALPWEELRVPAIAEEDDPIGRKAGERFQ